MTNTTTSTRSVADVKQHRLARVAAHLRTVADRIESSGDVDLVLVDFQRELEDVTPDGADWTESRPQRGQCDDEVFTFALQLTPYCPCNLKLDGEEGGLPRFAIKGDGHVCQLEHEWNGATCSKCGADEASSFAAAPCEGSDD
ncbi:MAG TPA: hypothetical protein VF156_15615 [Agromyces sp.]